VNPPVMRQDAGPVQADRVGPVGRAGAEHTGQRPAHVILGVRAQLVAGRQMKPGEPHNRIARPQIAGPSATCSSKRINTRNRALALVRRITGDLQGRLHPPDRHKAVARLTRTVCSPATGPAPEGRQIDPLAPATGPRTKGGR
jgi:hypothetical protein